MTKLTNRKEIKDSFAEFTKMKYDLFVYHHNKSIALFPFIGWLGFDLFCKVCKFLYYRSII